ncbi:PHD finger protein 3 [Nephila pilipes]|uniref:PHD finger protein 3 n=1 Tax=Nephila pilipes TaxID=299642 RepID=A0A8X6N9S6_NEPPI|nr:PHD finger protein 3 [Nephila pilipes]
MLSCVFWLVMRVKEDLKIIILTIFIIMAAEKSLIMNVSKDEMDTIDEILQSRQPGAPLNKKPLKLPTSPRTYSSAPLRITVPANVSLETVGALCELSADPVSNKNATECLESDDENNVEDDSYIPKNLEDLISMEHSYAIKYSASIESNENEPVTIEEEKEGKSISEEENGKQNEEIPIEEIEIPIISTPIRRSKRQIEKLEREQGEKENAANENSLDNDSPKTKIVKLNENTFEEKETERLKNEINLNLETPTSKTSKYSTYKSYSEFKKRHLKNAIDINKNEESKDCKDLSDVTSHINEDILQDSFDKVESKKDSITVTKEPQNVENLEHELKSKYSHKTKLCKSIDIEQNEKLNAHVHHFKKKKLLFMSHNYNPPSVKSAECKTKKTNKRMKKSCMTVKKISDESEHALKSPSTKKKSSILSSFERSTSENFQSTDTLHVNKRKKCVSFSEDLFSNNKPETVPKRQRLSTDCKDISQKNVLSPVTSPTVLNAKPHKKKMLRRESLRLTVNEDEPPLFSKPDVLIKVTVDDTTSKKDEKGESNLLIQTEESGNLKMDDVLAIKNDTKEKEVKNKILPDKQEEKEKLVLKIKEEEKEKDVLNVSQEKEKILKTSLNEKVECQDEEKHLEDGKFGTICNGNQSFDKSNNSNNFQVAVQEDCQHIVSQSTNPDDSVRSHSIFSNIEALFEAVKYNESLDEDKCTSIISDDTISTPVSSEKKATNENDNPESAMKQDCKNDSLKTATETESDNQMAESMPKPERKSRRIIKKKEFFGDSSDNSDNKKLSGVKKKKSKIDKRKTRGKTALKNKNSNINKEKEQGEKNDHLEQDANAYSDTSEEDDPKKLWCICRKPHNSRFMIQCDKCEDWFHGSCVGVTKQYGRQLEEQKKEWICPTCLMKGETFVSKDEKSVSEISQLENLPRKNSKNSKKANDRHGSDEKMKAEIDIENSVNLENIKTFVQEVKTPVQEDIHVQDVEIPGQDKASLPKVKIAVEELNTQVQEVKIPVQSSMIGRSLYEGTFVRKGNPNASTVRKTKKKFKSKKSKQSVNPKTSVAPKQNVVADSQLLDHNRKTPVPSTQSASSTMKSNTQQKYLKQSVFLTEDAIQIKKAKTVRRSTEKPTSASLENKRSSPLFKEKGIIKKKLICVNCPHEAKANASYCSDYCIEKYATECLRTLREAKGISKGIDFDSQRLVVLDRLKGNVITSENGPTAGEIISWLKANPAFIFFPTPCIPSSTRKEKECDSNSGAERKDVADETAKATVRLNVKKTLKNILMDRCKKADDIEMLEEDVQKIAVKIEEELNSLFKDNSFKYRAKYRSLMFNIKDPRNQGLFRKILKGNIPPDRLVRMSPEELASMELARWREQENQHVLDMIKRVQLEQQKSGSGLLLKKTHKGEVEIEDHLTSVIEQDIPKMELKDVFEVFEPEKEEVKDNTHLHRSHLFDLNCKICTGKIVPPPTDENISKKVRVAHSISVEQGSPNALDAAEKPASKVVDENSSMSSTDDSLDQEPTSTVSIESPEVDVKSCVKETASKAVWKGFICMQDVAKFVTSAYKVSGHTDRLQADLPDTIQVCGRIIPDQVWDYLSKIKQSGNKELIIVRFQAANEEEAVAYCAFYSYLSTRKRYGVVSNYSRKIKDFYLLPLAATSPVPMVLVPFDGPGLPSPRPHLLLGVLVRHKSKQTSIPFVPKQLPQSKIETENVDDSYTPPHEPRSYTPPLPTSSVLDQPNDHNKITDGKKVSKLFNTFSTKNVESKKTYTESFSDKELNYAKFSGEKEDDKPYDPEQDINNMPSGPKKEKNTVSSSNDGKESPVPATVSLEKHKKILDALTRQVEETDRQVNALKQLISQPEDDNSDSPNTQSLDISSVTETGMSSFLDLPENLQDILNAVRLKTHDREREKGIHEKGDVDMRIRTLFGKHFSEQKIDQVQHNSEMSGSSINSPEMGIDVEDIHSTEAATPPPNDEDMDDSSVGCLSDPRIKLRTNFQEISVMSNENPPANVSLSNMSASELIAHAQKQFTGETGTIVPLSNQKPNNSTEPPKMLLTGWSPGKEPPPPGIEPSESFSHENVPMNISHTSVPSVYATTTVVHDSSQHVNSTFLPQSFASFQPRLPLGFSVHTPPPNIKHFPPPPIVPTPFPPPPPPPLPMHVVPTNGSENNLVKEQWSGVQLSSHHSEGTEWHAGTSHWDETSDHQGNSVEIDSRYFSNNRSDDYSGDNFYKKDTSDRHWAKSQNFAGGTWVKHPSRRVGFGNRRRGKRGSSFRKNMRN